MRLFSRHREERRQLADRRTSTLPADYRATVTLAFVIIALLALVLIPLVGQQRLRKIATANDKTVEDDYGLIVRVGATHRLRAQTFDFALRLRWRIHGGHCNLRRGPRLGTVQ